MPTFRPGDNVQLTEWVGDLPRYLVGRNGTIQTMNRGRGHNHYRWYARILFDASTKPYTVPLNALKRI